MITVTSLVGNHAAAAAAAVDTGLCPDVAGTCTGTSIVRFKQSHRPGYKYAAAVGPYLR